MATKKKVAKATKSTSKKKQPQVEAIDLSASEPKYGALEVELSGPQLIVHNFSESSKKAIRDKQQGNPCIKETRKPRQEFEEARIIHKGKDCIKCIYVKKALSEAALDFPKVNKSQIKRLVFVEGIDGNQEFLPIIGKKPTMREDVVKIGKFPNKISHLAYRPEYKDWKVRCRIVFISNMITHSTVIALLRHAGFSIGIGDWRPTCDGQHGRFSFKVLKAAA